MAAMFATLAAFIYKRRWWTLAGSTLFLAASIATILHGGRLTGFSFGDGEGMARLIDAVFEGLIDDLVPLVQLLGDVELYLGALGFADRARAAGLTAPAPPMELNTNFRPYTSSLRPVSWK